MASPSSTLICEDDVLGLADRMFFLQLLHAETANLKPSTVFVDGAERLQTHRRSSQQVTRRCDLDFERRVCENVMNVPGLGDLRILRTHFDLVAYGPSDFFAPHRDFVALTSAELIPLTGLLCLEAPDKGGALHFPALEHRVEYRAGRLCLFDAQLVHEGEPVLAGRKIVLKFDALMPVTHQDHLVSRLATDNEALMACLDLASAKKSFLQSDIPVTLDLAPEDRQCLQRFFACQGVECVGRLRELLDYTCCPLNYLSDEDLREYGRRAFILAPQEPQLEGVANLPCCRVAAFSCAHWFLAGRTYGRYEKMLSWLAAEVNAHAIGLGPSEAWTAQACLKTTAAKVREQILRREVDSLETQTHWEDECSGVWHSSWDANEVLPPLREQLVASEHTYGSTENHWLLEHIDELAACLVEWQPASRLVVSFTEEDSCNDGDSYRARRYCTTVLRHAFVLRPIPLGGHSQTF